MDEIELKQDKHSKFGGKPEERSVEELLQFGIINLDKPSGPTSHQVSHYLKMILKVKKTGHSGTLDPKVTGVLPTATSRGTRIVQALLPAGKEYVCLMHIHNEVPEDKLRQVFIDFTGKIKQLPPVKSAVKRQIRERSVYDIEILEILEKDVLFRVNCQAGTYIRKLCHDIGVKLGTGAHMTELRRIRAGPFKEDTVCTLQDVIDALHYYKEGNEEPIRKILLPAEAAVGIMKKMWVLDSAVDALCHGATLKVPGISRINTGIDVGEVIAIMTLKNEVIGLADAKMSSNDIKKHSTGVAAKLTQVFMPPDIYPKMV
ncbi:MAG: RNA-guided pseudouridylation complex pseudouridine synthase subunit Cbf5 [Nanoarchaeota archaeon]|nr:RNA-guided pseudouridylation complex pseudouridine synthase subunit Cbf5 [Nanoarchaeota archaeon]